MSFEIIHDAEKGIAALVDAEFGRALGPIALGDKAIEFLDKFATSHGVDPATIPTGELEARWKDFVTALTSDVGEVDGEKITAADAIADAPGTAHAGAPAGEGADPTVAAETAAADSAATAHTTSAETGASGVADPSAGGERVMPVTSAKEGNAVCPTCDGWGEVTEGGQVSTCPTCKGAGEVPAHLDAEHAQDGK